MSAHKHLTFEDRIIIHRGLDNSSSRKSIAAIIGKDKSTVCKEVKLHSFSKRHKPFGVSPKGTYDCIHIAECGIIIIFYRLKYSCCICPGKRVIISCASPFTFCTPAR